MLSYSVSRNRLSLKRPNFLRSIAENVGITVRRIDLLITHLFSTVHRSDEMSEPPVVGGSVFIVRTSGFFIGGFVHHVKKNGAIGNLGCVWSRNWFADTGHIPVLFNGNCDCRRRYLYVNTKYQFCELKQMLVMELIDDGGGQVEEVVVMV